MSEFHSDISRDRLEPRVRSYDDNLDAQARALFDKNSLPHYNQGSLEHAARTRAISLADLTHLRNLLAQRNHIRKTGELPPESTSNVEAQLETARELLGTENVYGPEQVNHVFNVDLAPQDLPPIPYSPEDLEKAQKLGMILILRISHNKDGNPLTGSHMNNEFQPRFDTEGRGKLLFDTTWYKDEPFYTSETPITVHPPLAPPIKGGGISSPSDGRGSKDVGEGDTPRAEWKLVTRTILPDSTSKNYLEQTRLLRDTLKTNGWLTDEEAEEVTDEKLAHIEPLLTSDWKKAAELMANLKLTQHHRRTFSQALYDTLLVYLSQEDTEDRPLLNIYDWTATLSSVGTLVSVGDLDSDGAYMIGWDPGIRHGALGVCPSR